jgi:hypothetical protein
LEYKPLRLRDPGSTKELWRNKIHISDVRDLEIKRDQERF